MGLALATRRSILLLDEPLAGLAAAERGRVAALVKTISAEIPVLLVEHDIDRVFQIADAVTVMNEGTVLVTAAVDDARNDARVREIYIGSGTARVAAESAPFGSRRRDAAQGRQGPHLLRQEPHPQRRLARRARARDRRAARPQRRRQIDAAQDADRHRAARDRARSRSRGRDRAPSLRRDRARAASATCRRARPVRRHERRRQPRPRSAEAHDRRRRALGRRAHPVVLPAPRASAGHAGRLPLRRRAADGRGRARARRRCAASCCSTSRSRACRLR